MSQITPINRYSIGINEENRLGKNSSDEKKSMKNGSIFLGNNQNQEKDKFAQQKEAFKSRAMKVIADGRSAKMGQVKTIQKAQDKISTLDESVKANKSEISAMHDQKEALSKSLGIDPEEITQEEYDLIKKYNDPDAEALTEEEQKQLAGMSQEKIDYLSAAVDLDKREAVLSDEISDMASESAALGQGIVQMKQEMAKDQSMIKAYNAAEDILAEGNEELLKMYYNEAKENVEEKFGQEEDTATEKKKEETEETQETQETEQTETLDAQEIVRNNISKNMPQISDTVREQVLKLAQQYELVEEEIKGIIVDEQY